MDQQSTLWGSAPDGRFAFLPILSPSLSVLPSSPPLLFQPLREPRGVKRPIFLLVAQGGGRRAVKYEPPRSWFLFYTILQEKNYHHFIWRSERFHSPVSNRQGWFPKANACTVIENSLPSQGLLQVKLRGIIASWKGLLLPLNPALRKLRTSSASSGLSGLHSNNLSQNKNKLKRKDLDCRNC